MIARYLILSLFTSSVFHLSACGPAVENQDPDVPGGGLKKLQRREVNDFQAFNGALGDILHFMKTQNEVNRQAEARGFIVENRPQISRLEQRTRLRNSMGLMFCSTTQVGSMAEDYQLLVDGESCSIRSLYLREENSIGTQEDQTTRVSENGGFQVRKQTVESDLMTLDLNSQTEVSKRVLGGRVRVYEEKRVQVKGESKTLGKFQYTSSLRYKNNKPTSSSDDVDYIETYYRIDKIDFFKGFEATLYQKVRRENLETKEEKYYLNGDPIGKGYYFLLLQNLDLEIALSQN